MSASSEVNAWSCCASCVIVVHSCMFVTHYVSQADTYKCYNFTNVRTSSQNLAKPRKLRFLHFACFCNFTKMSKKGCFWRGRKRGKKHEVPGQIPETPRPRAGHCFGFGNKKWSIGCFWPPPKSAKFTKIYQNSRFSGISGFCTFGTFCVYCVSTFFSTKTVVVLMSCVSLWVYLRTSVVLLLQCCSTYACILVLTMNVCALS